MIQLQQKQQKQQNQKKMGVMNSCCVHQKDINLTPITSMNIHQVQSPNIPVVENLQQITVVHPLSEHVIQNLKQYNPFSEQLAKTPKIKKFQKLYYEGPVNQKGLPEGFGKIYYHNGSVFVGKFQNGIANGPGHYVNIHGTCYRGNIKNKKANDQNGQYESHEPDQKFRFRGSIIESEFHGFGVEEGENYKYEGLYEHGKITKGKLSWKQPENRKLPLTDKESQTIGQCTYEGSFDQKGLFTNQGILTNYQGRYEGEFKDGMKNGKGKFSYKNGLTFTGTYVNNLKEGPGQIITKENKTAYNGQFKNGLPHGRGWVPSSTGQPNYMNFNNGISSQIIE